MPYYEYRCEQHHRTILYAQLAQHTPRIVCQDCGLFAQQIITAPLLVTAQPECRYDSPVTGESITSWAARRNDLAKHNCVPYDPGSKQDYHRRIKESEAALDKTIDTAVEAAIEKMPTAQRAKLHSELVEQGTTADVIRR